MNSQAGVGRRSKLFASNGGSTALTAVALQDHLMRNLSLSDPLKSRRRILASRPIAKKNVKPVVDTGRDRSKQHTVRRNEEKKEYVLDAKPPELSLAQKMGLVEAPPQLLTEAEWSTVKEASNRREDSLLPCVICKEDFGLQDQVLLSCSHVFHRACLQAFERFTGKKTCPMCRKEQYQTRLIHEGSKSYRHKCATRIQALWRGYVVRCWYLKLRETTPPKDPKLRKKFYEEKLQSITDRMIRSIDHDVSSFLNCLDLSVEASRDIFRQLDAKLTVISDDEWGNIQLKAVERGNTDCPICLNQLHAPSLIEESKDVLKEGVSPKNSKTTVLKTGRQRKNGLRRQTVLLSCSHVFHVPCLEAFEEFSDGDKRFICPVCRSHYQKKIL